MGGRSTSKAQERKQEVAQIFSKALFQIHKWHSNIKQLEYSNLIVPPEEQSFAKQQLKKMLGLKWDKQQDTLVVVIPKQETQPTKCWLRLMIP